ncbi:zinc knuckle CX2CX4HX4C containing protein [Tanacetum coccineum]
MEQGFLNRSNKTSLKKDGNKDSLLGDLAKKVTHSVVADDVAVVKKHMKDDCEAGCSKPVLVDNENNHDTAGVTSDASDMPTHVGSKFIGVNTPAVQEDVVDLFMADVIIPLDEVIRKVLALIYSLYGYFVGKKLAFPVVQMYVKHAWAKFGFKHVMVHHGFFMFQFTTKDGMEKVLNHGPWRIRSVPLILHVWNPNSESKREVIWKILVWVKMFNVLVVAYSKFGLDLITSKLGRLIMMYAHTSNMCLNSWGMNSYARALVEISADKDFVESLVLVTSLNGKEHRLVLIDIDFGWTTHTACSLCKFFYHIDVECHKKGKKVNSKANMDDESVHIKRTTKGTNQGSTSKYKEDEIDLDQLKNNMNKLMEEEKVLDINTEAVTSGLDDGMAAENRILGVCFKEAKEAATMASSNKPKLSFGDLNLTNISDSDEEEVFASNEEFEAYLSSVGGGNQLEEEFDLYDDDYADQIRDLPGQIKEFRDFQLLNSGRK